jgi:hypothetical protein
MKTRQQICQECGVYFTPNAKEGRCRDCRFPSHSAVWHDVPGYEGRYQANVKGSIQCVVKSPPLLLRPTRQKNGLALTLVDANGHRTKYMVHRLVLMTFRPIENTHLYFAKCKSDDHFEPHLKNWEWAEKWYTHNVKLDTNAVRIIRRTIQDKPNTSYHALASQFGISAMQIYRIMEGKQWKDVS